jgi:DNA polymerase III epsilon subunit-like protein
VQCRPARRCLPGRITGVRDTFSAFNEPSEPIPPEITALTGITDDMVAGHRIDGATVTGFVEDAVIVIAHNAGFDRKFAGAIGRSSSRRHGDVQGPRSIGAGMGSKARGSVTC